MRRWDTICIHPDWQAPHIPPSRSCSGGHHARDYGCRVLADDALCLCTRLTYGVHDAWKGRAGNRDALGCACLTFGVSHIFQVAANWISPNVVECSTPRGAANSAMHVSLSIDGRAGYGLSGMPL